MDGITNYIVMEPILDLTPPKSDWVEDIVWQPPIGYVAPMVFNNIPGVDPSYRPVCPGEHNEPSKYTFDSMNGLTPIFGD